MYWTNGIRCNGLLRPLHAIDWINLADLNQGAEQKLLHLAVEPEAEKLTTCRLMQYA